jgi:hypothetical protein
MCIQGSNEFYGRPVPRSSSKPFINVGGIVL